MIRLRAAAVLLLCAAKIVSAEEELPLNHQVVLGEPYSATRRITTEETPAGGKPIRHIVIRLEARNAKGWEWSRAPIQENGMEYTEAQQIKGTGPMAYVLWDPEKHQRTEWCSCKKKISITPFNAGVPRPENEEVGDMVRGSTRDLMDQMTDVPEFKVAHLDQKQLLGVMAQGTLATRADAVTTVGFGKRDTTTGIEVWYAPELHLELSTLVSDARAGITGNSIIALTRGEPSADLFKIPDILPKAPREPLFSPRRTKSAPSVLAGIGSKPVAKPSPPPAIMPGPAVVLAATTPAKPTEVATVLSPSKPAVARAPSALPELNPKTKNKPATTATRVEKPKIYKKAPPGWPAGLPPL